MKKNVMMRIASVLLVAVLLSTSAISGTFAKYVTTASGTDSARVAKWGVSITAGTGAFQDTYTTNTANIFGYSGDWSVDSSIDADKVVAPGTSGTVNLFTIAGTPEVAVNVSMDMSETTKITLPKGTYEDLTTASVSNDTFKVDIPYNPVRWKLSKTSNGKTTELATGKNLQEIAEVVSDISDNYDPNTDLGTVVSYDLSWEWVYGSETDITDTDKMDTYLGNVIAGTVTNNDVITTEAFNFSITVTQVD